ncbi:unnamed protein product [Nesidiocoris tenuis]|uniref:Uncharacterized protein n=1 Tax=Nesidiocoris tenuis TaxID=355587 RepID=A0A6H5HD17_9HEMI|nr:unnamed protein product [Nesidiocoris tenuis]
MRLRLRRVNSRQKLVMNSLRGHSSNVKFPAFLIWSDTKFTPAVCPSRTPYGSEKSSRQEPSRENPVKGTPSPSWTSAGEHLDVMGIITAKPVQMFSNVSEDELFLGFLRRNIHIQQVDSVYSLKKWK